MRMPTLARLVYVVAVIGAIMGCLLGGMMILGSLGAFRYGLGVGFFAISTGAYMVLGSLAALGVTQCFLALVEAAIDTRNAVCSPDRRRQADAHAAYLGQQRREPRID